MGSSYGSVNSSNMESKQQAPDKTRMLVQGRSDGDGMETTINTEPSTTVEHSYPKSTSPSTFSPPSTRRKEPKFVPYEPYKAAVSPIIPPGKERKTAEKVIINPSLVKPLVSKVIKESAHSFPQDSQLIALEADTGVPELSSETAKASVSSPTWLQEKVLLEDRIQRLEEEKKELATQFSIQTKVNADLKKLLVASLGEDMQAKVQYMSEDKAKLGEHVLLCSQKLSQNNEELEKLSLQCNMWKSKFEASSLLVNELAGWKVVLSRKFNEATEALQYVLEEHGELHQQLARSFNTLLSIQQAFDPSAKKNAPCPQSPWNMLQLAGATLALSEDIQLRLLGTAMPANNSEELVHPRSLTHGEQLANELIGSLESLPDLTKQEMQGKNGMKPGATACSVLPHICSKETPVNCCRHCSGKVQYI